VPSTSDWRRPTAISSAFTAKAADELAFDGLACLGAKTGDDKAVDALVDAKTTDDKAVAGIATVLLTAKAAEDKVE
jgi:hypothetical protein